MEPLRSSCVVGGLFQSGLKQLSSCLPSFVFSHLHWLTLAFRVGSTLFSGWSRFTMAWMPARDSLPSHYVSVHWLLLRDCIFNDRYSGLRVVGMLTFHHLWDLSSGGTYCFPMIHRFFFFVFENLFLVLSCMSPRMADKTEGNICHTDLWEKGRQSGIGKNKTMLFEVCRSKQAKLLYLSLVSLLTSSCLHALGSIECGDKSVPCDSAARQACTCQEKRVKEGDGGKGFANDR